ncbi:FkbM family methyltransferase [Alteraurantiacibacter buctensis]|uniref:FkbM family methyltransferase n=1 Tax=Alteraurantiacibacter buctensis TaxID=1503981 RepID=A0A844Z0I8_9SPHN|nr:FkbM family methyltransferase [Alteraurantiacibacter buctensis]MXO72501.1 FkbM family methyltransferase [Alteraurantiacibacter buctensis]
MKQMMRRAGVAIFRWLPLGHEGRRRVRKALLAVMGGPRRPFVMDWRGFRVQIDPGQAIDMRLHFTGDYEPATLAAIKRLAYPGSTAIDVGANVGLVSLWLTRCVGPAGRVIAVEPSAWACERLADNAALSGVTMIETIRAAVADRPGEAVLDVINGYNLDNTRSRRTETVTCVTVDQLVAERGITNLSLLKVDTDGFEMDVFRGAQTVLSTIRPDIVFEYGPDHLRRYSRAEPEALIALLRGHGYAVLDEHMQPLDPADLRLKFGETANLVARPEERLASVG